jgi:hypothetical protein
VRARWLYILAVCFVFPLQTAKACTCKNSMPIQRTSKRYAGQSVFTARIVALLGQTYHYGGKPSSSKVIALVQTRFWGIPWYWPSLVVLDGGTLCGMTLYLGEEYLVAGHPERYGVLDVSGCTGTKVLIAAQPDLRTLDGPLCAAPGGTIIGQIMQGEYPKLTPIADLTVSVKNSDGELFTTRTGKDGIYEFRHLPASNYTLDLQLSDHTRQDPRHLGPVTPGVCLEGSIYQ